MSFFRKFKDFVLGEDLLADGNGPEHRKASTSHGDSHPRPETSHTAPQPAASASARAQAVPPRQAPPPLLQDGHPVTGGGVQARALLAQVAARPGSASKLPAVRPACIMIPTPVTSVVMLPKITRRPLRPPPTRPRCSAQGLQWYTSSMRQDADGDMADQFLSEPSSVHGAKRSHTGRARELPPLQTQHGQLQQAAAADVIVDRGNVYVVPAT